MSRIIQTVLCVVALGWGCRYDAPPESKLVVPEGGVYHVGDALTIAFTEPVLGDSLSIQIWMAARDIEGVLLVEEGPLLENCSVNGGCALAELSLSEDRMEATLILTDDGLGKPDVPMTLEIQAGLTDDAGISSGISRFFDFQFVPSFEGVSESVPFVDGFFVIGAVIDDPIEGVNLKLIGEIRADGAGGLAMAMGAADPIGDAPKNTMNPESLKMDVTSQGYGVHAVGKLVQVESGERFLETEPFVVNILLDNLGVKLEGLTLSAKVIESPEFEGESLDGTLAYKKLILTNSGVPFYEFEAGTVTFTGRTASLAVVPEGAPTVCGDTCGWVEVQCDPPADFPPPEICGGEAPVEESREGESGDE